MLTACNYAPAPVEVSAEACRNRPPVPPPIEAGTPHDAGNYGYTTWTFWPPKSDVYSDGNRKVWSGDMTSAEFLQELQTQFDERKAACSCPQSLKNKALLL